MVTRGQPIYQRQQPQTKPAQQPTPATARPAQPKKPEIDVESRTLRAWMATSAAVEIMLVSGAVMHGRITAVDRYSIDVDEGETIACVYKARDRTREGAES